MRRIQTTMFTVFCFLFTVASAQVNSDSLIGVFTQKMNTYLDKEKKASDVFSFTKNGIEVFVPATDSSEKRFDFDVTWDDLDLFKKMLGVFDSRKVYDYCLVKQMKRNQRFNVPHTDWGKEPKRPQKTSSSLLKDIHIALDPGHIAGDLETGKMEKKWVDIKSAGVPIIEGELTLATALLLKSKLEAKGATVMLTRDQPNVPSFGFDFVKWTDSLFIKAADDAYARQDISFEEKNYLLTKATNLEIFRRFFLLEDLRERARKINEFRPDLTLVIHYNVDETNTNWNKPTKKNFNMSFVGGSFTADELDKPEARIEFLRLLLTDDIERSVEFSKYMMESLVEKTKVPAALDSNAVYLKDNCMKTGVSGVYCRNLTLTRKVKGVICYGESLYQDNVNESKLLSKKEVKVGDLETSKRVEEVAEAYFQGILNYIKNKK